MKAEKDTLKDEIVTNNDNKVAKQAAKRKKETTQFSTTIPTSLFEEMSDMMENHGLDRTQVITILFSRLVSDSEYTVNFLFPKQEQITTNTKSQTTNGNRQENNIEI